jgi:hypothetical protein
MEKMDKIIRIDRAKKGVLQKAKEEMNSLQTRKRWKTNLIGHSWRRNCLLIHVVEGNIEERQKGREDEEGDLSN